MKFYIVDDDPAVAMILQQILEKNGADTVVGTATSSTQALTDLAVMDVDILLSDLLMPELSGIDLVKRIKALKPRLSVIMISQVRTPELRAEAYQAGIEFFIDKPINVIEVKTVVEKVTQNIQMATKLENIQSLVGGGTPDTQASLTGHAVQREKVLAILRFLGISSEAGSSDILAIAQIMLDEHLSFREIDFQAEYHIDDHEKKILFQRVRRAIKTGLTNLATLYLDDLGDDLVLEYANALYDYQNVRLEMLYLQGKRSTGGKTALRHFFDGLVQESDAR